MKIDMANSIGDFYPRSPCGERLKTPCVKLSIDVFLSTLSLRRATTGSAANFSSGKYFYPRSPCGERLRHCTTYLNCSRFLSTLSLRRATIVYNIVFVPRKFLSTLSLRRATEQSSSYNAYLAISIHALLAESDFQMPHQALHKQNISIHALLAESDTCPKGEEQDTKGFLSTLSLRRATQTYPRDGRGPPFLSTLSLRRATNKWVIHDGAGRISIHALLAESDNSQQEKNNGHENFYPRSPCGERRN